jgi:HTH-like domain
MSLQGGFSIERMCYLTQVSRAGFYRHLRGGWPADEELILRSAVQEIVLEHRWRYGYRRATAELRQRGTIANHKRVARIMNEDNLLAVRKNFLSASGSGRCQPPQGSPFGSTTTAPTTFCSSRSRCALAGWLSGTFSET